MAPPKSQVWNRRMVVSCALPDPGGAGVLGTNFHLFRAPADLTIKRLTHRPDAAWVAAAAANDGVVTVKRNNTGVAVANLSVVSALAAGSVNDMGAISATTGVLSEGDNLTCDIGAALGAGTANAPSGQVIVEFEYNER